METRARIGIRQQDGTIRSVSCGPDASPGRIGENLLKQYDTAEKVIGLIDGGDIAGFADQGVVRLSERNRCDPVFCLPRTHAKPSAAYAGSIQYLYVFEKTGWQVARRHGEFRALTRRLIQDPYAFR